MQTDCKRKVAVFGGSGFIGSNFAKYSARAGAHTVVYGNTPPPQFLLNETVDIVELDATDSTTVLNVMRKAKPEVVVFGISRIVPRVDTDVNPEFVLTEIRSLMNVIQGASECGIKQLVYCSSGGAVYGEGDAPHLETDKCSPRSLYGQLKLQTEALVSTLCGQFGIEAAILRISNPYGPGQSPFGLHGVVSVFTYKLLTEKPIEILGSLEAVKDYIYINDVSAAIWAAIEKRASGIFNIGSGTPTALRTLIEKISEVCAIKPSMNFHRLAATEVSSFTLNIAKALRELRWSPVTDMNAGITITKQWIEKTYL